MAKQSFVASSGDVLRRGEMRNGFGACANSPNTTSLAEKQRP